MRPKALLRISASVAVALLGFASVAYAQNQPPPPYNPPPGYQQQPPPIYQQQPPPPAYQQPPPAYQQPPPAYQQPPAYYPPPPPPPRGMYRDGFLIGFAIGFGGTSAKGCGDFCGGAFAGELHVGAMLNPRFALMFDGWFNAHPIPNSDGTTTNSIAAFAAQYWLTDIIWLKGGLGFGTTQVTSDSAGVLGDATGLGIMGGAGVEVFQGNGFAFDLQFRVGAALHNDNDGGNMSNFGFLAGFNWY